MDRNRWAAWREAWTEALYGPDGFFRIETPGAHFRTSAHVSTVFAEAVVGLARRHSLTRIVDLGAGAGELLAAVEQIAPGEFGLTAVEVAERPHGLDPAISWRHDMPERIDGLVVANEYLDNVPCDVVEVDEAGALRLVEVDPVTGDERLGETHVDPWLDAWWPLAEPGDRAEVGRTRDDAWADVVSRLHRGVAVAVDYGHLRDARPPFGSLRSYAHGNEVDVRPDGSRDVTASVAVDAVAARVGGTILRQREVLRSLGVDGGRPPLTLASTDPTAYVRALSRAGESAELGATGGLGDFWWIMVEHST